MPHEPNETPSAAQTSAPQRAARESALRASSRMAAFARSADLKDLAQAVAAWRSAAALTAGNDAPERTAYLINLAIALFAWAARLPDDDRLDELVGLNDEIDGMIDETHSMFTVHQATMALTLQLRYERRQNAADLEGAIGRWEAAVRTTPPDDQEQLAFRRHSLQAARMTRAIMSDPLMSEALETGLPGIEDSPLTLRVKAVGHFMRYRTGGPDAEAEAAIELLHAAIAHPETDAVEASRCHHFMGLVYLEKFSRSEDMSNIDHAIEAFRVAAQSTAAEDRQFEQYFADLANAQTIRLQKTNDPRHAQDAVDTLLWLRDRPGVSPAFEAQSWLSLCFLFQESARRTGSADEAEAAVDAGRRALQVAGRDTATGAKAMSTLATALAVRGELRDDLADVRAAADLAVQAFEATAPDEETWAPRALNAGVTIQVLLEMCGEI